MERGQQEQRAQGAWKGQVPKEGLREAGGAGYPLQAVLGLWHRVLTSHRELGPGLGTPPSPKAERKRWDGEEMPGSGNGGRPPPIPSQAGRDGGGAGAGLAVPFLLAGERGVGWNVPAQPGAERL